MPIKIKEELLNLHINDDSDLTLKDVETRYNTMEQYFKTVGYARKQYVIVLMEKESAKYLKFMVDGLIYDDENKAIEVANELNKNNSIITVTHVVEELSNMSTISLAQIAMKQLEISN